MRQIRGKLHRCLKKVTASTITEYAIIVSIVSIAAVAVLMSIGRRTNNLLDTLNSNFPQ